MFSGQLEPYSQRPPEFPQQRESKLVKVELVLVLIKTPKAIITSAAAAGWERGGVLGKAPAWNPEALFSWEHAPLFNSLLISSGSLS